MKKRITALLLLLTLSVTSAFLHVHLLTNRNPHQTKQPKTSKSTSTKKQELTPVTLKWKCHLHLLCSDVCGNPKGIFCQRRNRPFSCDWFRSRQNYDGRLSGTADIGFMGSEASIYTYNEGANDYVVNFASSPGAPGTSWLLAGKILRISNGKI